MRGEQHGATDPGYRSADRLLAGLDRLERELGVVQEAAETAEARNVGLLD